MRSTIDKTRVQSRLWFLFALLLLCIWLSLMQVEFINCVFKSKRDNIIYDLSFLVIMNDNSNEIEHYLMSTGSVIEFDEIIKNSNKDAADNANKNVLLYFTLIMTAILLFLNSKAIFKEERNETF